MRYPPPAHAATVWLAGEELCVSFNNQTVVQLRPDEKGFDFLLGQLRQAAARPRISQGGNPTQWDYAKAMQEALDAGLRPKVAPRRVTEIDTDNLEDYL